MRRRLLGLLALAILLAGLGLLAYPNAHTRLEKTRQGQAVTDYRARMATRPAPELDALYRKMVAYNEHLAATGQKDLVDPWSYQVPSFDLRQFGLRENVMGYLDVPRIGVHAPIYLGASLANLRKGATQLSQTSLPVGGDDTNAVIAGHRLPQMFWNLDFLRPGDPVIVTNFHDRLRYEVVSTAIIRPTDVDKVLIRPGQDLVTLISCNPRHHNYQRIVVYARLVDRTPVDTRTWAQAPPGTVDRVVRWTTGNAVLCAVLLGLAVLVAAGLGGWLATRRRRHAHAGPRPGVTGADESDRSQAVPGSDRSG